ncbi:MAG TPA: hypothetical protein VFL34_06135 [Candidatus Sulfotelmatobacter sp.]|nr:hypothetical protein [Candidatus Sulfotelmatobacter sp.]
MSSPIFPHECIQSFERRRLIAVDDCAAMSIVDYLSTRSRLCVTKPGFIFVEGCGKTYLLMAAVLSPELLFILNGKERQAFVSNEA